MSAKAKRIERSQRFRRAWRGENRKKAVSPVVATLILILIAVAAAAALYLWLVVWQGNITGGIGTQHAEPTLTIGGSTSVYPFSSLATTWFEQNNSDVVVSDNQGGTGAGMIALCEGNINLGASSTPQSVETLESSYGCGSQYASTITITTVAYDAVDVVIASSNPHGLLSISADTLNAIYETGSSTKASCFTTTQNCLDTINGAASPVTIAYNTPLDWDQIPAMAQGGTALVAGVTYAEAATTVGTGTYPAVGGALSNDIVCAGAATGGVWGCSAAPAGDTPCGFEVCASGGQAIVPVERSDASGTTQTFEAKVLGYGSGPSSSSSTFATTQDGSGFSSLGYGGCGSNNLLSDCGFTFPTADQGNGNPGVLSIVAANTNSIGYASDGLARTAAGIGTKGIVPFLGLGQNATGSGAGMGSSPYASSVFAYGGIIPTTGTSGSISAGLTASTSVDQFVGGRPFELISLEPLSGVAQEFVTFVTDPANNAALASATDEVGLYQVV